MKSDPAPRNLLFDLDGTLVDSQEGIFRCIHYAMEKIGMPLGPSVDLRWCVGPPLQKSFIQLAGGDPVLGAKALGHYRERYGEKGIFECRLYEGIPGTLAALAPAFQIFLSTSKPTVYAERVLKHFEIDRFFTGLYGSELDGTRADKADLIRYLLAQESLEPARTRMVGDRKEDVLGAHQNGVRTLGAGWGFGEEGELARAGAEKIFKTPQELKKGLKP